MLSSKQLAEFERNGFLNGGRVVDDATIQELRSELDRVIQTHENNAFKPGDAQPVMISRWGETPESTIWQVVNIWEASPAYERLLYLKPVVEAVAQLTNQPTLQIWHDQIQYKPPRHGGINMWHQDWPYWPVIRPPGQVTAWIPLDDVDESNGCMWMVPGSHKWGNQIEILRHTPEEMFFEVGSDFTPPDGAEIRAVERVPWAVKVGEVSFHHSMTWHGSHRNQSDRPRRAIAIHFMTGQARFVAAGQHVMKKFIQLEDGEPMERAGEHFPIVRRDGKPVAAHERLHYA